MIACNHIERSGIPCLLSSTSFFGKSRGSQPSINDLIGEQTIKNAAALPDKTSAAIPAKCEKAEPIASEADCDKPKLLPVTTPKLLIKTYSTLARSTPLTPASLAAPHMKMLMRSSLPWQ